MNNHEQQFATALAAQGMNPPEIIGDGKIHRFDGPDDKAGKKSAWYVLHIDQISGAAFGDWKTGMQSAWCSKEERSFTPEERDAWRKRRADLSAATEAERQRAHQAAAAKAAAIWTKARDATATNPYCIRKQVKPYGLKEFHDAHTLIVPIRTAAGALVSLQFIYEDSTKKFLTGGALSGCYYPFGGPPVDRLLIVEGFATGASVHEATSLPVAVAFNAGNLLAVARAIRAKLPKIQLIICADDDAQTAGNPGMTRATEAARAVNAALAVPDFGSERPAGATDFNDLAKAAGLDVVCRCVDAATTPARAAASRLRSAPAVVLSCAFDIQPEAINWLWPSWLPAGKLTLLAGSPGTGKTTLAIALAAVVTTGGKWPDTTRCRKAGQVLMWSGEDDPADTLVPRLIAAGADLRKVHFVRSVTDENGELQPFDPATDIGLLGEKLNAMGGAALLIIDPIVSAVSGDAHRANDVRRNLQALVDMAAQYQCSVLGISHFAKGTRGTSPAERVIGSQAFVALARMVLVAGKDEAAERRILARAKANNGPDDGGVSYTLEQIETNGIEASRVVWGELIDGTAREILGDVEQDDEEKTGQDEAQEFLAGLLADGPMRTRELKGDADGAGFNWKMMQRAASKLCVEKRKVGMKEGWEWALPKRTYHEEDTKNPALSIVSPSGINVPFVSGKGLRAVDFPRIAEGDIAERVTPSGNLPGIAAADEAGGAI